MDFPRESKKKNRKYSEATLKRAIENVLQSNMTLYRASKEFKIPWTTLKENLQRVKEKSEVGHAEVIMSKIGRPYALTVDLEHQLVSYIIKMQEIGFGLTVNKIRELAYTLAEAEGIKHNFNPTKKCAGWSWWVNFKQRFALSLRSPENLSAGRAICSNAAILEDFYDKLGTALTEHDLMDCPERIWNCDETGLTFVNKPDKVVTKIGKKYIYNRTYAEKGTTTTVLACINAAGYFIAPMVIFKGVRNVPELSNGSLPNSLTRLSPKGWINSSLFLEWLSFFAANIPPVRPVMLIMDSHASHISPQVLEYAKSQQIVLFTMPAHTSHLLQPLDVGVFRPLKVAWREELQSFKQSNPNSTPTRYDFQKFFTPAYEKSFTTSNIRAGFRRAGIYPLDKTAICSEAIAPSLVTDKPLTPQQTTLQEIFVEPDYDVAIPQAEIPKVNDDPLRDAAAAKSYNAQICNEYQTDYDVNRVAVPSASPIHKHQIEIPVESNTQKITKNKEIKQLKIVEILVLPKWAPKSKKNPRTVPKAACLTPIEKQKPVSKPSTKLEKTQMKKSVADSKPSSSSSSSLSKTSKRGKGKTRGKLPAKKRKTTNSAEKKKTINSAEKKRSPKRQQGQKTDDDWMCSACGGSYSDDVSLENGAEWITCSFCIKPYHLYCQSQHVDKNEEVFMCDHCSVDPNDSDEDF